MNKLPLFLIGLVVVIIGGFFLYSPDSPVSDEKTPFSYTASEYDLSFLYPKNYTVVLEKNLNGEREQHTIVLVEDTPANRELFSNSNLATEWPPTITVTIFQNNLDNYTLQSFVEGTNFSNFKMSYGTKTETNVNGEMAWRYRATGLYENDNVVVVRPKYVYMFTVFFNSPEDQILKDFDSILETVKFANKEMAFNDGKYLGYIHNVDIKGLKMSFDDVVWLNGKVGQDAAIEAGHCTEETRDECLPNDYFIKNAKVLDENLGIDSNVLIFMQTWKMEETGEVAKREIGFDDFAGLINKPEFHWNKLPYNITVQNGKIMQIEEVYIP